MIPSRWPVSTVVRFCGRRRCESHWIHPQQHAIVRIVYLKYAMLLGSVLRTSSSNNIG
jgi:hypothetical protein